MKLIVSIDTEADNQWDCGRPVTTENVRYWQPFQTLCDQYGIPPSYLITSEIAADPRAVAFLRPLVETKSAEVGGHLHPWTTPPFRDEPGLRYNDVKHLFPSQLDPQLLQEKLRTLTGQITQAFDCVPRCFRAGRFGFHTDCAEALCNVGYQVDSSVTPLISWASAGGPDFRKHPVGAYWAVEEHEKRLLEIPLTILITRRWLRWFPRLIAVSNLFTRRLFNKIWAQQPLWLRPFPGNSAKDLIAVWREAERLKLSTAVMMLHSSELMPGGSPYIQTQEAVDKARDAVETFFDFVKENQGEGTTFTEALRAAAQGIGPQVTPA